MPGYRFSRLHRSLDLAVHFRISKHDAGEVHDFSQSFDPVPGHPFGNIARVQRCSSILQMIGGRHAGRKRGIDLKRQDLTFLVHPAHALRAKHVGDFVRIHKDAGRPFGQRRLGELGHRQHGALNVHMPVQKPGNNVASRRVDHDGVLADRVLGIPHEGDSPFGNGDVRQRQQLPGVDIDQRTALNDQIGLRFTHGDIRQRTAYFIQLLPCGLFHLPIHSFNYPSINQAKSHLTIPSRLMSQLIN
ncbi:hypothetical protein D3C81_1445740 [compost metagenome]